MPCKSQQTGHFEYRRVPVRLTLSEQPAPVGPDMAMDDNSIACTPSMKKQESSTPDE